MNCSVVIFDNVHGKRDVAIVDSDYLPDCFFINNHISTSFADLAEQTKYTYAKHLLFSYRYFNSKAIDLPERASMGTFLTREEYEDFKTHCKYRVESDFDDSCNVASFSRFSDKQLDNWIYATQSSSERVGAYTLKERLRLFLGYMQYLYKTYHCSNIPPVEISHYFLSFERMIKEDIKNIKDENYDVKDPLEQVIPDEVFFEMLEIIKPSNPNNPWKGSKLRNQLIVNIFIETGIRKGALAKLKSSNVKNDAHGFRIMITRTPNDVTDKRRLRASQKTKPHSSAISEETFDLIELYIETERVKYSESQSHDFILVSEKGNTAGEHLSVLSINYVIKSLSNALKFELNPHLFRHKWNELFDEKASAAGYSSEQIEDIRKYAMGWDEDSKMGSIYNEFKHALKVHELSAQRQKDTMPRSLKHD
ncbi:MULTISPECIES: site-specific integrase [Vibrio]|uniref:site-specific integrase n=1 Tax=Vibrio TaxID=662 RepID=UPI000A1DF068|nr:MULTISPECIES: site-specific integrase [Vibrio]EKO3704506.1 site-specific integrase [Vibrio metschnikovii]HDI3321431.1 site-specific integrase [Vibrio cholerae]EGQ7796078.1 site-specific integrase [Vibrio parahaemolyticus]MCR9766760.1 site-specific integrase [Vibrio parahaemolyticus]MCX4129206.1 site-specific integrase [Vibrio parahaemolyticus]